MTHRELNPGQGSHTLRLGLLAALPGRPPCHGNASGAIGIAEPASGVGGEGSRCLLKSRLSLRRQDELHGGIVVVRVVRSKQKLQALQCYHSTSDRIACELDALSP